MSLSNLSKVVFVRPPNLLKSGLWKKQGVIRTPLNLAILASYIRKYGEYDCSLVDFETINANSPAEIAMIIINQKPKYVGFTTLTPRFPITVKIAQEIKKQDPWIINIIGGPHITGAPFSSMYPGIDYGIIGEGEEALLELLNALENKQDVKKIRNLLFIENRKVQMNETRPFIKNIDELPLPAFDLININEYVDYPFFKGVHIGLCTSRGCPYNCSFCASNIAWKRTVRLSSSERVIEEILYMINNYKINNFLFFDDNFDTNKKRAFEICDKIIKNNIRINYVVQIRADSITLGLAEALKKSGCIYVAMGIESGNEEMLRKIGKKETKEQIRKAVSLLKEINLPIIASYIIGLPGDTHETIRETIDFAFELDADQSKFMLLAPVPGTTVYDLACSKKLIDPFSFEQMENTSFYDSVSINLSNVSNEDLIRYQDEAYERFDKSRNNI